MGPLSRCLGTLNPADGLELQRMAQELIPTRSGCMIGSFEGPVDSIV